VPGLTVDVYVNGEETLPDFEPGTLTDPLMLAAGSYDIEIYADGDTPDSAEPALSAEGLEVPGGANLTLVAHLGEDGTPMLSAFANDTSEIAAGEARLTVRHLAAAPAVDVRAGGSPVVEGLTNPDEASLETAAGTVAATARTLSNTLPVRRIVTVAVGVGLVAAAVCYLCPHWLSAVIGGAGAACTAAAVQVGSWLRRSVSLFRFGG